MSTAPPPNVPPPTPPSPPSEADAAWQRLRRDFEEEVRLALQIYIDTMSSRAVARQRRRQALVKAMTPGGSPPPAAAPQPVAAPQPAAPPPPTSEAQQALAELKRDFPAVLLLAMSAQPTRTAHLLKELLELAARADAPQVAQIQQRLVANLGRLSQLSAARK